MPKLIIKVFTMTNPDMVFSRSTKTNNDDTLITIKNLDIMWMTRDPGLQEIHATVNLDFLVISFKILHHIEKVFVP